MVKIKDRNYSIQSSDAAIEVRSLRDSDLPFYAEWYKGRFTDDFTASLSEKEFERFLQRDLKENLLFIIFRNAIPCGEITVWNDTTLVFDNGIYAKPVYSIWFKFYGAGDDAFKTESLKLFIELAKTAKEKINTLYTLISKENENDAPVYKQCGFAEIGPAFYRSKTEKFMEKNGLENVYKSSQMLIRQIG
ncbi:hypothetical protein [Breznakiella homolactica]|uniref:N-acetyltransferase domain-containing protein n=1 Tax=Breznakiella homolactica TaxID=2798577 RepID=A0A7T8BB59_9SPIR|nr:hypothetical protein [Breznakiella homolactica]QQO10071.1 hypothetical protein JFL75_03905 [Breznakiella homolactica]